MAGPLKIAVTHRLNFYHPSVLFVFVTSDHDYNSDPLLVWRGPKTQSRTPTYVYTPATDLTLLTDIMT
jgi:hypothetical protein